VPTDDLRIVHCVCQNPDCRKILEVPDQNYHALGPKPRCACGSDAKKVYSKPTIRRLTKMEAEKAFLHGRLT
jgi:hypothetical protein